MSDAPTWCSPGSRTGAGWSRPTRPPTFPRGTPRDRIPAATTRGPPVVNIDVDEVTHLVQRYLSTGAMVIVVLLGPGRADAPGSGQPTVATVVPGTTTSVPPDRATPDLSRTVTPRSVPAGPGDVPQSP